MKSQCEPQIVQPSENDGIDFTTNGPIRVTFIMGTVNHCGAPSVLARHPQTDAAIGEIGQPSGRCI